MAAPVRNTLGNTATFIAKVALKEGQPVEIDTAAPMQVDLFNTHGGRPDGVAITNTAAGGEVSVAFPPAIVPVLIGNETADAAATAGGNLKVTAQGNFSKDVTADTAGFVYALKSVAAASKGALGSAVLLPYGSVKA